MRNFSVPSWRSLFYSSPCPFLLQKLLRPHKIYVKRKHNYLVIRGHCWWRRWCYSCRSSPSATASCRTGTSPSSLTIFLWHFLGTKYKIGQGKEEASAICKVTAFVPLLNPAWCPTPRLRRTSACFKSTGTRVGETCSWGFWCLGLRGWGEEAGDFWNHRRS